MHSGAWENTLRLSRPSQRGDVRTRNIAPWEDRFTDVLGPGLLRENPHVAPPLQGLRKAPQGHHDMPPHIYVATTAAAAPTGLTRHMRPGITVLYAQAAASAAAASLHRSASRGTPPLPPPPPQGSLRKRQAIAHRSPTCRAPGRAVGAKAGGYKFRAET